MDNTLLEFVDSGGAAVRVDRDKGVIRGVKILGLESRNGRRYPIATLTAAAPLYEGVKVNVDHPADGPLAPREYRDRIGVIRGVSVRPDEGLFADFHFNPKHALAEQLAWDAQHTPENVGFSHNVQARTTKVDNRMVVEEILAVNSVDLVADPATTRGLFEAADPADVPSVAALTLESLAQHRPDLLEELERKAADEQNELREQLNRLQEAEAVRERRETARRLLRRFSLPELEATDPWSRSIISESFTGSLLECPDEPAMLALVQERARLVRSLAPNERHGAFGPVSRDQNHICLTAPASAQAFAESITH